MRAVAAADLRRMIAADGGFTVDRRTGRPARDGISLCTRPSQSMTFSWAEWNDASVDSWVGAGRSALIGGWRDPASDDVWLDVVRIVPSRLRPAACLVGRALGQHCLFDLGRRETVSLRGGVA